MAEDKNQKRISELEEELSLLPQGYVVYKEIHGRKQPYLQWKEGGRTVSRYIKTEERDAVLRNAGRRKEIVQELKALKGEEKSLNRSKDTADFRTNVLTGDRLSFQTEAVIGFGKRDCYSTLGKFMKAVLPSRICVLYGLRRTGKTTMLFQAYNDLDAEEKTKAAYIKARTTDSMADIDRDLDTLWKKGFRYVFIDEVTLLDDFIDSSSMFSDVYAAMGMKIVLSGTDSLGFWLSLRGELYDRAVMIHTTWIPFSEYSRLLGIDDIDEYICYGGTLQKGELEFDDPDALSPDAAFRDDESTRRYIDSAVCMNIQHSLLAANGGNYLRHLRDLYEKNELTGAINRLLESMTHRFLISTLTDPFKSHDLGSARNLLRKQSDPEKRTRILDEIDRTAVTEKLMKMLQIRNTEDMEIGITDTHLSEIKEYLRALDLVVDAPRRSIQSDDDEEYVLFTQPGMRYSIAQTLVHVLISNSDFRSYTERERNLATGKILEDVRGRMMEDMVLLETVKTLKKGRSAFKLTLARSEFDMLIYDSLTDTCEAYEVKHSSAVVPRQYHVLEDEVLCRSVEEQYGEMTRKCVIYCGEPCTMDNGVEYINVVDYLKSLG